MASKKIQAKRATRADGFRNKMISAVHANAAKQGFDEGSRRALYQAVTGKRTLKDMNMPEIGAVLDRLHARIGGSPIRATGRQPQASATQPYQRKVRAMWLSLYHLGAVQSNDEKALGQWLKRTVHVDFVSWLDADTANKAIEGLKIMLTRAGVVGQVNRISVLRAQCAKLGIDGPALPTSPQARDKLIREYGMKIRKNFGFNG